MRNKDKGNSLILLNFKNLSCKIKIVGDENDELQMQYAANGTLLSRTYIVNNIIKYKRDYITNIEYKNDTISIDLEYVSNQLFDIIKPQIKLFRKFIQEYRLTSKLYIILEIENDKKPSLFIDKQMMEILILLNGEIDIDLYLLNNN